MKSCIVVPKPEKERVQSQVESPVLVTKRRFEWRSKRKLSGTAGNEKILLVSNITFEAGVFVSAFGG